MKRTWLVVAFSARLVFGQSIISTVAGNGEIGFSGDGGPATSAALNIPSAVAVDASGNIYIADRGNNRIRRVSPSGTITTIAGTGSSGITGDGGSATGAALFLPDGVAVDSTGSLYIAESQNIRKVDLTGKISQYVQAAGPSGMVFDSAENLYISDHNNRIQKITPTGTVALLAGTALGFSGDGGPAANAAIYYPGGVALDASGNLYFVDAGNNRVRKISTSGIVSTVAGNGTAGFSGDGGPAVSAQFRLQMSVTYPALAVDRAGNIFIADTGNNRIRKVDPSGIITTFAGGGGLSATSGDGGPATSAGLLAPWSVALDSAGNLYIADTQHGRIRKVSGAGGSPGGGSAPNIASNGVVNGASFLPGIAPNSWATIQGSGLSSNTDTWDKFIVSGKLPTTVDGVSVTISGKAAYVNYISAGQINLIVPDINPGPAQVTVTNSNGTSAAFTVNVNSYMPAFFLWPGNQAVATRQDFTLAVRNGTFSTATAAAKPGDVIVLWGTGFGPTSPSAPAGVAVPPDRTYSAATLPTVTINNVPAVVYGVALAPGFAGLYQVAIQIPPTLADGDWPLIATTAGASSASGVVLSIRK